MELGNRVLVLGCPGSGKSTFARRLREITHLPLIYLDSVWWRADRTHITREEFDSRLEELLSGDSWIMEGDYSRTYEKRIAVCDTAIVLDPGMDACMRGIIDRIGKARPDIPWTEQALDPELVEQVRNHRETARPRVYELIEKYPEKQVIILKDRKEAEAWLSALRKPCRK